jgi:integrase
MKPTGYVRIIERQDGPVFYAKLKLPDGTQPQRRLGRAWTKRTRPPEGYLTPGQAESQLAAMLAGEDPSLNINPSNVTFAMACHERLRYLRDDKGRKPSTIHSYTMAINKYLLPHFGQATPVEHITTAQAEALRDRMLSETSRRTVQKTMVVLHGVMSRAKHKGWITVNPCDDAEKVALVASDDFNILEPEQVLALARAAEPAAMGELFVIAAYTGLRVPGELIALRWEHVDFWNRIIHVQRNFTFRQETTPKGKRRRSVPMSDQAMAALGRLSKREHFTAPGDLVFCTVTGGRVLGDEIREAFYAALTKAGLGHLRDGDDPIIPYDLRHTFGTLAVRKASLSDVQAWMGHQDISTTMRYVHYVPQHDAAAKLTAAFEAEGVHRDVHRTADISVHTSETEST